MPNALEQSSILYYKALEPFLIDQDKLSQLLEILQEKLSSLTKLPITPDTNFESQQKENAFNKYDQIKRLRAQIALGQKEDTTSLETELQTEEKELHSLLQDLNNFRYLVEKAAIEQSIKELTELKQSNLAYCEVFTAEEKIEMLKAIFSEPSSRIRGNKMIAKINSPCQMFTNQSGSCIGIFAGLPLFGFLASSTGLTLRWINYDINQELIFEKGEQLEEILNCFRKSVIAQSLNLDVDGKPIVYFYNVAADTGMTIQERQKLIYMEVYNLIITSTLVVLSIFSGIKNGLVSPFVSHTLLLHMIVGVTSLISPLLIICGTALNLWVQTRIRKKTLEEYDKEFERLLAIEFEDLRTDKLKGKSDKVKRLLRDLENAKYELFHADAKRKKKLKKEIYNIFYELSKEEDYKYSLEYICSLQFEIHLHNIIISASVLSMLASLTLCTIKIIGIFCAGISLPFWAPYIPVAVACVAAALMIGVMIYRGVIAFQKWQKYRKNSIQGKKTKDEKLIFIYEMLEKENRKDELLETKYLISLAEMISGEEARMRAKKIVFWMTVTTSALTIVTGVVLCVALSAAFSTIPLWGVIIPAVFLAIAVVALVVSIKHYVTRNKAAQTKQKAFDDFKKENPSVKKPSLDMYRKFVRRDSDNQFEFERMRAQSLNKRTDPHSPRERTASNDDNETSTPNSAFG